MYQMFVFSDAGLAQQVRPEARKRRGA